MSAFREFVGPADPEIARHIRPNTLRAQFGLSKVKNSLHCTDLPEDGVLEVTSQWMLVRGVAVVCMCVLLLCFWRSTSCFISVCLLMFCFIDVPCSSV